MRISGQGGRSYSLTRAEMHSFLFFYFSFLFFSFTFTFTFLFFYFYFYFYFYSTQGGCELRIKTRVFCF